MKSKYVSFVLVVFSFCLRPAFADAPVAFIEGGSSNQFAGQGVSGFDFTVSSPINVTRLGYYGLNMGGGDEPWVALYDVTNAVQLAAITSFAPDNGWQYLALGSPVSLTPGITYQVVANSYWADQYDSISGFTFGAEIVPVTFTAPSGWSGWGSPSMGTGSTSTPNVTANFEYAAVPEPSAFAAFAGVAVLGFVAVRRRRR